VTLVRRKQERGNAMILSMIVLTALATLSSLTVVTVQGGLATTGNDRFTRRRCTPPGGGAAAMDYAQNTSLANGWQAFVTPANANRCLRRSPATTYPGNPATCSPPGCSSGTRSGLPQQKSDGGFLAGKTSTGA
jgi:hypothetical protein